MDKYIKPLATKVVISFCGSFLCRVRLWTVVCANPYFGAGLGHDLSVVCCCVLLWDDVQYGMTYNSCGFLELIYKVSVGVV